MNFRKLSVILLASASLAGLSMSSIHVAADTDQVATITSDTNQETGGSQNSEVSDEQISQIDQYIKVVNNQYVLELPQNTSIPSEVISDVKNELDKTNATVKNDGDTINPSDKTIEQAGANLHGVELSNSSKPIIKHFWWGIRVYMRSKTAVNKEINEFKNGEAIASLGSLISPPIGITLATYFGNIADYLENMRDAHPHSKLYMDISRFGIYKIKTC